MTLKEAIAELEHKQWEHWSKDIFKKWLSPLKGRPNNALAVLIARWEENWKPYGKLDEKTKDLDRIWADKVLALIRSHLLKAIPKEEEITPENYRNLEAYWDKRGYNTALKKVKQVIKEMR